MSANLPYPNIDFVPLDVLTAAELNQMVQNDQYLANFWSSPDSNNTISSNHIADNAIKSNHLSSGIIQRGHLDNSDFTSSNNVIRIGGIKIMAGRGTVHLNGRNAYAWGSAVITLPEPMSSNNYTVVASLNGDPGVSSGLKICGRVYDAKKIEITVGTMMDIGTQDVWVSWVAIG